MAGIVREFVGLPSPVVGIGVRVGAGGHPCQGIYHRPVGRQPRVAFIAMHYWHNDDLIEQSVEDNLKVLQGLHRVVSGLRYDVLRRALAADGMLQQHVLRGRLPGGAEVELHAAKYLQVRDGHITRIEEYLDSAKRSSIKAAREALSG